MTQYIVTPKLIWQACGTFNQHSVRIPCPEETRKKINSKFGQKNVHSAHIKCQGPHLILKSTNGSICIIFHIHLVPRRLFITYQGERLLAEDLNVAFLEPARETLRSRRRRAALSEVINELDDFISDIDDE